MFHTYGGLLKDSTLAGQRNFRMMVNYACECKKIITVQTKDFIMISYSQHREKPVAPIRS